MDNNYQEQIDNILQEISLLKQSNNQNEFSDLSIFTKKAIFNSDVTVRGTLNASTTPNQYKYDISHSNAELTSQTYDDTVTSTFKPHTVYFYGKIERGTDVANSVGQAGRTAPTQGVCSGFRYSGGSYNTVYETTKLGSNDMGNIYVLSWSDTGVVLRTTLAGYTGQNATITGTVILIG